MQEEVGKEIEGVWIRKSFRILDNPLLAEKRVVFLSDSRYEFLGTPFPLQGNYLRWYELQASHFARQLNELGFRVDFFESLNPVVLTGKKIATEDLPGVSEKLVLRKINCVTSFIQSKNYLLKLEEGEILKLGSKFGFSKFRKKFEDRALLRRSEDQIDPTDRHQAVFNNYLKSGKAKSYFETRNALTGHKFSTRLSHLLNLGCLTPGAILAMLEKYENQHGANKSTYWIKFELLWREYFYWLYHFHQEEFFMSEGLDSGGFDLPKLEFETYLEKMDQEPLIRAMNRELMTTGYLSNRSRQIYASYLVHHTDLDWRYGAWFFQHHLHDFDLYSNWGNWLYASGYGTDSRGPRYFKISKQLKQYDPNNLYLSKWG